jgi:tRNA (mo5U34)-methyltransferase
VNSSLARHNIELRITRMSLIPILDTRRSERLRPEDRVVMDALLKEEIAKRRWYHRMDLGNGVTTPGFPWEHVWEITRRARSAIDYKDKTVLDLGSWDGMWAFEAEMLGGALVVATDCSNTWQLPAHEGMNNLLLVRQALFSQVVPLFNVSPYALRERVDNALFSHPLLQDGFDIVQHLGLLYHLRDPLFSLAQSRSVLKDGGTLLLETAVSPGESMSMRFNAGAGRFYDSFTTWWAPTLPCLLEMLRLSLFEPEESSIADTGDPKSIFRLALRAKALQPTNSLRDHYILDPAFGHGFGERLIQGLPPNDQVAMRDALEEWLKKNVSPPS